ncbi:MAG: hypothetical protein ACK6DM_05235 [Alphaproteobacteria bacterium]
MSTRMRRSLFIWLAGVLVYGGFLAWYGGWRAPLSKAEVDGFMQAVERIEVYQGNDLIKSRLRTFLEADDGEEFFMVNLLRYRSTPQSFDGMKPGESAREVMERYSSAFMPSILGRAGWMVSGGRSASPDLERWGVEPDGEWEVYALIRYRSRRDLAEIISNPAFNSVHPYKFAAIEATRAFPVAPAIVALGPKLVVGLITLVLVLTAQLISNWFARRG